MDSVTRTLLCHIMVLTLLISAPPLSCAMPTLCRQAWGWGPKRSLEVVFRCEAGLNPALAEKRPGMVLGGAAVGHAAPAAPFDLSKATEIAAGILAIYQGKRQGANLNVEYYHTGDYSTGN